MNKTNAKMKQVHAFFTNDFKVLLSHKDVQIAEMVLPPAESEGGPDNSHRGADQWLFVVSGRGHALIKGKKHQLTKGSLIVIERGETHEIRNTGRTPLKTLNIYSPLAYKKTGAELLAAKP
jgi:mannose-6-phosphate isomerase-like protein (cupin superfamily)